MMDKDKRKERFDLVINLRQQGATYKKVAEMLGISTTRALQIYEQAIREREKGIKNYEERKAITYLENIPVFTLDLSVRATLCLKRMGLHDKVVGDLLSVPYSKFDTTYNLGHRTFAEINNALIDLKNKYPSEQPFRVNEFLTSRKSPTAR